MERRAINKRHLILAVVLILGLVCGADAQTPAPNGGPREGITVHGHWIIDVRNPDGSLASHTEFENELASSLRAGPSALAGILGRRLSVGQWMIRLSGGVGAGDSAGPCTTLTNNNTVTIASSCDIVEPTSPAAADSRTFKTLALAVPMTTLFQTFETGTIELSGFVTATSTTQIGRVWTIVGLCGANVLPAACAAALGPGDIRDFTSAQLAAPVAAQVGQIIQVKVILSFS